jgi:hypothetical protein
MNAWLLAAFLCAPVSAQVVETAGAAAPVAPVAGAIGPVAGVGASLSPISVVPGASILAPGLNLGAVLKAFPGQAATGLPAGAVRFAPAPLPSLPAAAASAATAVPGAPRQDAQAQTGSALTPDGMIPPAGIGGSAAARASAAPGSSTRIGADAQELSTSGDEAGVLDRAPAEGAVAFGRKIFDRAGDSARLEAGSASGAPGASALAAQGSASAQRDPLLDASAGGTAAGETLRDAVASPLPAAATPGGAFSFFRIPGSAAAPPRGALGAPGAAPASIPVTFERLFLELGDGLVVKVRAILSLAPAASATSAVSPLVSAAQSAPAAAFAVRPARAPITSTEWLERRGLLESLSVSEAAASQEAAALIAPAVLAADRAPATLLAPAAAAPKSFAVPAPFPEPAAPIRVPALAWFSLAFLPAVLVLLDELH